LPLLAEDFVDDFNELLAVEILQRIEVPAGLVRDLVTRFAFLRHIPPDWDGYLRDLIARCRIQQHLHQLPHIHPAKSVPNRKNVPAAGLQLYSPVIQQVIPINRSRRGYHFLRKVLDSPNTLRGMCSMM
jgi:hypothetical protein